MERISYNAIPEGMFEKLRSIEYYIHSSSLEIKLLELLVMLLIDSTKIDLEYLELLDSLID